jgi:tetratricopeptide (TPR) repeat protein
MRDIGATGRSRVTWAVAALLVTSFLPRLASGQAPDRVMVIGGSPVAGTVVSVSQAGVDIENSEGQTQSIGIETIREVQFGAEPQSVKNARSMLLRGRGVDARDEVAKIGADELADAEPLVLAEVDYVTAAAAGRAALDAGGDVGGAIKAVAGYLAKHAKSHHFFEMQELAGDLAARAAKPAEALAAYEQLAAGPPALKVRAAAAKAGLLLGQGKVEEALKEYEAAVALAGNDKATQPQKRTAELGRAKCLALSGKHDAAVAAVQQIIDAADPEEKELLSRAYAVLGAAYRGMGGREQDALIQYLTIDLVYNTLPETHAEALFNLAELWAKGGRQDRAREAQQNLKEVYPASPWAAKLGAAKP